MLCVGLWVLQPGRGGAVARSRHADQLFLNRVLRIRSVWDAWCARLSSWRASAYIPDAAEERRRYS